MDILLIYMNIFLIFSITSFFPSLPCMQRDALIRGVRPKGCTPVIIAP